MAEPKFHRFRSASQPTTAAEKAAAADAAQKALAERAASRIAAKRNARRAAKVQRQREVRLKRAEAIRKNAERGDETALKLAAMSRVVPSVAAPNVTSSPYANTSMVEDWRES